MKKSFQTQLLLVLALTFLNLVLLLVNIGAISIPEKGQSTAGPERPLAQKEISMYKVGKKIEIAGYNIKFTNPRYEFDKNILSDSFKVDARVENKSFKPHLMPIFNCEIIDGTEVVVEGSGVILNEIHRLLVGEAHDYIVTVPLEIDYTKEDQNFVEDDINPFPNRKVSSCSFTPTGSYDPNFSVKIVFD